MATFIRLSIVQLAGHFSFTSLHRGNLCEYQGNDVAINLPAIETELLKLLMEAEDEADYVFPEIQVDTNLRTTLEKFISTAREKQ